MQGVRLYSSIKKLAKVNMPHTLSKLGKARRAKNMYWKWRILWCPKARPGRRGHKNGYFIYLFKFLFLINFIDHVLEWWTSNNAKEPEWVETLTWVDYKELLVLRLVSRSCLLWGWPRSTKNWVNEWVWDKMRHTGFLRPLQAILTPRIMLHLRWTNFWRNVFS